VDENTGNPRETMSLAEELIARKPGAMVKIVGDDTSKRDPERRVGIARVGSPVFLQGLERVFPHAPIFRCPLAYRKIGLLMEQTIVGTD
jgi:hypothetical protein